MVAFVVLANVIGLAPLLAQVTSVLSLFSSVIWENKQYTVFFVWILAISFVVLWSPGSAAPEPDQRPRWIRRAELSSYRRATKPRRRYIRVHHKAPTLHEQALFRRLDIMHFNVLRFLDEFRTEFSSSGRSPRGERPSEGDNHCVHDLGPKQKSKGRHKTHHERHSRNTHHVQSPSVSPPASPR
jgi:hypothetical protein